MSLQTAARPEGASTLTQQETRLLNEEVLTLVYGSTRRSTLVALLVATTILTLQHQYALLAPWWACLFSKE